MRAAKRARKKKKLYAVHPGDDKPHRIGSLSPFFPSFCNFFYVLSFCLVSFSFSCPLYLHVAYFTVFTLFFLTLLGKVKSRPVINVFDHELTSQSKKKLSKQ